MKMKKKREAKSSKSMESSKGKLKNSLLQSSLAEDEGGEERTTSSGLEEGISEDSSMNFEDFSGDEEEDGGRGGGDSLLESFLPVIKQKSSKPHFEEGVGGVWGGSDRAILQEGGVFDVFDGIDGENGFSHSGGEDGDLDEIMRRFAGSQEFATVQTQLEYLKERSARLSAPQSSTIRDKADRKASYEASKKFLARWTAQLKRNCSSEQLTLGETPKFDGVTVNSIAENMRPIHDFDREIEESLAIIESHNDEQASLVNHDRLKAAEPIRRKLENQQAARLKALLFREHQRNRRLGKIKSKMWHKIHKKSELRARDQLMERLESQNPELAEQLRADYEKKLARMRLQRRQQARKKWSQVALRFGGKDVRKTITEQAQIENDEKKMLIKLSKRLPDQGASGDDSDEDLSNSDEDEENEEKGGGASSSKGKHTTKAIARARLRTLKELKESKDPLPNKGLFSLPFMRKALDKQRMEASDGAQKLLDEIDLIEDGNFSQVEDALSDEGDSQRVCISQKKKEEEELIQKIIKKNSELPTFSEKELAEARKAIKEKFETTDKLSQNETSKELLPHQPLGVCTPVSSIASAFLPPEARIDSTASLFKRPDSSSSKADCSVVTKRKKTSSEPHFSGENEAHPVAGDLRTPKLKHSSFSIGEIDPISSLKNSLSGVSTSNLQETSVTSENQISSRMKIGKKTVEKNENSSENVKNPWISALKKMKGGVNFAVQRKVTSAKPQDKEDDTGGVRTAESEGSLQLSGIISSSSVETASFKLKSLGNEGEASAASGSEVDVGKVPLEKAEENGRSVGFINMNDFVTVDYEQQKLVAQAFIASNSAETDFSADILKMKAEEEKEAGFSGALPGWGHWVDKRTIKKPRRRPNRSIPQNELSTADINSAKTVIISNKMNRKLAGYMIKKVPAPFETAEQYEASISRPIGPEWNVSAAHHRLIQPKVNVRIGAVVKPLEYAKYLPKAEVDSLLEVWTNKPNKARPTKAKL